jgi:transposase
MRALEPEVMAKLWAAVEPLIPDVVDRHPLGTHRRRISDRVCFEAIVTRLILGCSWIDVETLFDKVVSDTTLRGRRTEWVTAGVFTRLADVALHAYDRIIGLDLSDCAIDGSCQKAPCGGDGTGPSPVDRAKLGWKWSILTDRFGIPFGWTTAGANRNDIVVAGATLDNAATRGLLQEIETLHLDKGYDSSTMRTVTAEAGLADVVCAKRRKPHDGYAMACRTNQLVDEQLRTTPPQHRPLPRPPRSRSRLGHRRHPHREARQMARTLGTMTTYPRIL